MEMKKISAVIAPLRSLAFSTTNRTTSQSTNSKNAPPDIECQSTIPGNLQTKISLGEKVSAREKDIKIRLKNIGGMWQSMLNSHNKPCKN